MTGNLRLIGYRRVSSVTQIDRYGLPAQQADLDAYAATTPGVILVRTETDEAKTGSLPPEDRPGLLAALKSVEDGEADGLLIPGDLDRLARELTVQEGVLARVWKTSGAMVHSTTRGEVQRDDPDDPMRTAMRQMMGVFAQLDRALAVKRMRNGRKAKAEAGGYVGYGSPAFGLRSVDGELTADEREAAVIRVMRELRGQGMSYQAIAETLNEQGLRSKRDKDWYAQTVSRVLART